jgi:hypothetical protein
MGAFNKKGFVSTLANPGDSKLLLWIRDVALPYEGDDCLVWPFARLPQGYGFIGRNGTGTTVHRFICQHVYGSPPGPGYQAAHSCLNGHGGCVNPHHISWKTVSENAKEAVRRRKLTPTEIKQIRAAKNERPQETAKRFGVREVTIRRVQGGRYEHRPR